MARRDRSKDRRARGSEPPGLLSRTKREAMDDGLPPLPPIASVSGAEQKVEVERRRGVVQRISAWARPQPTVATASYMPAGQPAGGYMGAAPVNAVPCY